MPGSYLCVRLGRFLALLTLAVLTGCQAVPARPAIAAAPGQPVVEKATVRDIEENRSAESLRVFLADTRPRADWFPVHLRPSGVLYVKAAPIIERRDLIGIQSATDQAGGGVLILILSDQGFRKMQAATTANPGLRLALVVGQTMLAAPGYVAPVSEQQLAFGVGSARNAELAARAVAGVQ